MLTGSQFPQATRMEPNWDNNWENSECFKKSQPKPELICLHYNYLILLDTINLREHHNPLIITINFAASN